MPKVSEEMTIKKILDKYYLPVCIQKEKWSNDFYFRIERVEDGTAKGTAFKNGEITKRRPTWFGDYKYDVSETAYVFQWGDEVPLEKDSKPFCEKDIERLYHSTGFIKKVTKVFVKKNGEWKNGVFQRFEIKNGSAVAYVLCDNEESFYAFPSDYLKINEADVKASKDKEKESNKVLLGDIDDTSVLNLFNKNPSSRRPDDDYESELSYEKTYQNKVNEQLNADENEARKKLNEAEEIKSKAYETLREAYIDERESDSGFDPFNAGFHVAQDLEDKATKLHDNSIESITSIHQIQKEPFIARIDCGRSLSTQHTIYIGNSDVKGPENDFVYDWRNKTVGNIYYYTDIVQNALNLEVALKRVFTFQNAELIKYTDSLYRYNNSSASYEEQSLSLTDSFFNELLDESRKDEKIHDIIKTIQQNQYRIITSDFNSNALVCGCAGSGKTMILYHRLSYLAYNDSFFSPQNVYAVTPSRLFSALSSELVSKLKISEINNTTYFNSLELILRKLQNKHNTLGTIETVESTVRFDKKLLQERFKEFDANLTASLEDPVGFSNWLLSVMNSILTSHGEEAIKEGEYYRRLFNKQEIASLLNEQIRSKKYERVHIEKVKNGAGNFIDERVVEYIPRLIATYSIENIEKVASSSTTFEKLRRKYESVLINVLAKKPKKNARGDIEPFPRFLLDNETIFASAISLLLCEKLLSGLQSFLDNNQNVDAIFSFIAKSAYSKMEGNSSGEFLLFLMRAMVSKYGPLTNDKTLVFLDEFQNYSAFELDTIQLPFSNCVCNFYGDFEQCIDPDGVSKEYFDSLLNTEKYSIMENYRNAFEITEFINEKLHKNMTPIGIHGTVNEVDSLNGCVKVKGRTAIIVHELSVDVLKDLEVLVDAPLNVIENQETPLEPAKVNVIPIQFAKGLEFETVYAVDFGMSDNEKYVAYTRALKELWVVSNSTVW